MKKISFLILILGITFFLVGCSKNLKNKEQNKRVKQVSNSAISGKMKDLLARGQDLKCTFSKIDGENQMESIVYIAGKKSFTQVKMKAGEYNTNSYVLNDGEYTYTWSDRSKKGTKTKLDDFVDESDDSDSNYDEKDSSYNEDYDYQCVAWKKDNSKFNLPKDINFVDLSNLMNGMSGNVQNDKVNSKVNNLQNMCSLCDKISDAVQKEECQTNLNCK